MSAKKSRTDEKGLADEAMSRLALKEREDEDALDLSVPQPGKPLPVDFVNPPAGKPGHRCLDPQGRYQPGWYALKLHKTNENMPQRQYFNMNGQGWYVEVGVWVDVPQAIVTILSHTEQQIISMDMTQSSLTSGRGVPRVVDIVPRFSYTMIASV